MIPLKQKRSEALWERCSLTSVTCQCNPIIFAYSFQTPGNQVFSNDNDFDLSSWILSHLGLNYWKEHRCWAAEVISNEVPNCVKEKCDFSTPRTAHPYSKELSNLQRRPSAPPPALPDVSTSRLCSLLERLQNCLFPNFHRAASSLLWVSLQGYALEVGQRGEGSIFPPIMTKQRSEIAMYYKNVILCNSQLLFGAQLFLP